MESISIDFGIKKIAINNDPNNVIEFNPTDVNFYKKWIGLLEFWKQNEKSLLEKSIDIDTRKKSQDMNISIQALKEEGEIREKICHDIFIQIDSIFGNETSKKVFGNLNSEHAIGSFLEGVMPFINDARAQKIDQYLPVKKANRKKHAVMK